MPSIISTGTPPICRGAGGSGGADGLAPLYSFSTSAHTSSKFQVGNGVVISGILSAVKVATDFLSLISSVNLSSPVAISIVAAPATDIKVGPGRTHSVSRTAAAYSLIAAPIHPES